MRASYSVESSWSCLRTGRSVLVLSFLNRIFRVAMMRGMQGGLGARRAATRRRTGNVVKNGRKWTGKKS